MLREPSVTVPSSGRRAPPPFEALSEELDPSEGFSHHRSGPSGQLPGDLITQPP